MIDHDDLDKRSARLQRLFEVQMGIKARSLPQALRRAGRRLPKRLRKQGAVILQTQKMAQNPKLARQLDSQEVDRAFEQITAHLETVDLKDERFGRFLGIAGIVSANLLIIVAGFVWWLWWQGHV